ncbi:MAG: SAVED domain-containing protein [Saccharofermentanales bacterium]|jgi:hypothetical protein
MEIEAKKVTNISRNIQDNTTRMLWGVSAGMCEFRGCKNRLFTHPVTKENVNLAECAHIYAFSEGGKRYSRLLQRDKINDINNLMLVCGHCHNLIDSNNTDYSAKTLLTMKKEHEERVSLLTSIKPDLQSEVIIYNCNIADRSIRIKDFDAVNSITPEHYPARENPINLSPDLRLYDNEEPFWDLLSKDLERRLVQHESIIQDKHISLFAIAPQPLLFKLGTLINRNYDVDVRQSQSDISSWSWQGDEHSIELNLIELSPEITSEKVALTIEITAQLSDEEIQVLFNDYRTYRIIANACSPAAIKSKADLRAVIDKYREALNKIRLECVPNVQIALLLIAPASVSIEAGRLLAKGDPAVTIYDRNFQTKEWIPTLSFNGSVN